MTPVGAGGHGKAPQAPPPQARPPPQVWGSKVQEVQQLYGKYNPEKLADVPGLVTKYGEDQLLNMVRKKYRNQEMDPAAPTTAPNSGPFRFIFTESGALHFSVGIHTNRRFTAMSAPAQFAACRAVGDQIRARY
jgi:hypothetical protein